MSIKFRTALAFCDAAVAMTLSCPAVGAQAVIE